MKMRFIVRPFAHKPGNLPRQQAQVLAVDHALEVADDRQGHAAVAQQNAHLDVALTRRLGEVGRGDEQRLVVHDGRQVLRRFNDTAHLDAPPNVTSV